MACSPMPKVGGAAAPSAPPVPTPMLLGTVGPRCLILYYSAQPFSVTKGFLHRPARERALIRYSTTSVGVGKGTVNACATRVNPLK